MEIEGKDGSKTLLNKGLRREFGRGLGFPPNERTVSRRHVSFELKDEARVYFEVIGKNPIWVCNSRTDEIRVYRRFERGEMEEGDMFCVSAKKPVWFTLKRVDFEGEDTIGTKRELGFENELAESLQSSRGFTGIEELELDSVDVSNIDPVKEFGFVVMGHEFDAYPKKMIREIKNWDWCLEEPGEESEDDEVGGKKGKKGVRRKRKKGQGDDDDNDWTGESEDDKDLISKSKKIQRPKYATRSEDLGKSVKNVRVEFGFVVMGHEFDAYRKKMICDIEKWDWFLEEPGEEIEDDEVGEKKGKKGLRRKRKKGQGNDDDDDWMGESEDDKELITKSRKVQRPKYSTRSEDRGKPVKDARVSKNSRQNNTTRANEKDVEDDDTLGGFIVDDQDLGQEVESAEEEDEDEEEEEDYEEDDEEEE